MVKYVNGCLIKMAQEGCFDVICHSCNCFVNMGSGIAPQIKKAFPEAYEVDCETKIGDESKLGTITYTKNSPVTIVNIYGQFGYGNRKFGKPDIDYEALRSGLQLMKDKFSGKKFGLPKIGSGLASGNWNIIEKIIEDVFRGEYVTIVNYVP